MSQEKGVPTAHALARWTAFARLRLRKMDATGEHELKVSRRRLWAFRPVGASGARRWVTPLRPQARTQEHGCRAWLGRWPNTPRSEDAQSTSKK